MSNLENGIGLESYFGGKLRFHTSIVHISNPWQTKGVPDGQPIPPNYQVVKAYAPGEVTYIFKNTDGSTLEEYHSHDSDVTSWAGVIPVKHRTVKSTPTPSKES